MLGGLPLFGVPLSYLCRKNKMMVDEKIELNTWDDCLDHWCPAQCYYYFMHGDDLFCIYLRWRHDDPWTVNIIKCKQDDANGVPEEIEWKWVKMPYFIDDELDKLKEFVMNRLDTIMAFWPQCEDCIEIRRGERETSDDE